MIHRSPAANHRRLVAFSAETTTIMRPPPSCGRAAAGRGVQGFDNTVCFEWRACVIGGSTNLLSLLVLALVLVLGTPKVLNPWTTALERSTALVLMFKERRIAIVPIMNNNKTCGIRAMRGWLLGPRLSRGFFIVNFVIDLFIVRGRLIHSVLKFKLCFFQVKGRIVNKMQNGQSRLCSRPVKTPCNAEWFFSTDTLILSLCSNSGRWVMAVVRVKIWALGLMEKEELFLFRSWIAMTLNGSPWLSRVTGAVKEAFFSFTRTSTSMINCVRFA
jgi:hypothetical protein